MWAMARGSELLLSALNGMKAHLRRREGGIAAIRRHPCAAGIRRVMWRRRNGQISAGETGWGNGPDEHIRNDTSSSAVSGMAFDDIASTSYIVE